MNPKILELLTLVLPFIEKLIESTVVPTIKRKAYQRLDEFTNDRIEDLANLVEKINKEENPIKKQAHLEGLKLGIATLEAVAEKLQKSAEEFKKVIE